MSARDVARTIADAIRRTLGSPEWCAAFEDDDERSWLMLLALCEVLHPLGAVTVPSPDQVEGLVARGMRDEAIWRAFDGRNYGELATRHGMTPRQVRRIIEKKREEQRAQRVTSVPAPR